MGTAWEVTLNDRTAETIKIEIKKHLMVRPSLNQTGLEKSGLTIWNSPMRVKQNINDTPYVIGTDLPVNGIAGPRGWDPFWGALFSETAGGRWS